MTPPTLAFYHVQTTTRATALLALACLASLASCARKASPTPPLHPPAERLLLVNDGRRDHLEKLARDLGLRVSGSVVLSVEGAPESIETFAAALPPDQARVFDESIEVELPDQRDLPAFGADVQRDMRHILGIDSLRDTHAHSDGRGIAVAVIDDGIAPDHFAFQKTTVGSRKFRARSAYSTRLRATLSPVPESEASTWSIPGDISHSSLKAGRLSGGESILVGTDTSTQRTRVCLDRDKNTTFSSEECLGVFSESGEYGFWDSARTQAYAVEYEPSRNEVRVSAPEGDDGHAEAVASVLLGTSLPGGGEGLAPGAELLDYDISEPATEPTEDVAFYTMARFLAALEWAGQQGARVCNISYALHFLSPQTQQFAHQALKALIKKYNYVIVFSAGNNGPAVGSYTRGLALPKGALSVGAFVTPQMAELHLGLAGIEGVVPPYSATGPAADGGTVPNLIAPTAFLVPSASHRVGLSASTGSSFSAPVVSALAASLASAIIQAGLPFDAPTLVQALLGSARRVDGVPFLKQGFGLPHLERALALYETFATLPVAALASVSPQEKPGLIMNDADLAESRFDVDVTLAGSPSPLIPRERWHQMIEEVDIEYSHPWLDGPSRTFLSTGGAHVTLSIDPGALSIPASGGFSFGEVRFLRKADHTPLLVYPITIRHARSLATPLTMEATLAPLDSRTFPFFVPPGDLNLELQIDVDSGSPGRLLAVVTSDAGRRHFSVRLEHPHSIHRFALPRAGSFQLSLVREEGNARTPLVARARLARLGIGLQSQAVSPESPIVALLHSGKTASFHIGLLPGPREIEARRVDFPVSGIAESTFAATPGARHAARFELLSSAEISPSCFVGQKTTTKAYVPGEAIEVEAGSDAITVRCALFEHGLPTGTFMSGLFRWFELPPSNEPLWVTEELRTQSESQVQFPALPRIWSAWPIQVVVSSDKTQRPLGLGSLLVR